MTATQSVTFVDLPLRTGRWVADPSHSALTFSIRHLGLAKVRGRFGRFEASLDVGSAFSDARVEATIAMDSIDTNNPDRDAHLRSSDFFSTDRFPEARFVSTEITEADTTWMLMGLLTLNGITRVITLSVEFNGVVEAPVQSRNFAGFSATGSLRRSDFGINFGLLPFGADKLALSDEVKIELDLEFVEPEELRPEIDVDGI